MEATITQLSFGSGALWGERVDQVGSGIGPRQFGILQDVQIGFDWSEKELYGQYQFPVAIARGTAKITGTAKFAQILGLLFTDIFFGQPASLGQFNVSQLEAATIPSVSPFTATVANAANYNDDLGVAFAASGQRLNRVTTPSQTGQYTVNFATGVYTFSSADAGAAILISYTYNTVTSGSKLTITNQLLGFTPAFKATFYQQVSPGPPGQGGSFKPLALRLNACTASKLSLPTKVDDWTISDISFNAFADASGTIGILSSLE
jgi:hypothetical protein